MTVEIKEERMTTTGMHILSDVFCVGCGASVGWKYVSLISNIFWFSSFSATVDIILPFQEAAHETSQEGKIVLARCAAKMF